MRLPRPFEGNYGVTLTVAIFAISPFVLLTTAYELYEKPLMADLASSQTGLSILSGLAVAAYAFGALLAGDLVQRFVQRRLFAICQGLFVIGCVLGATAGNFAQFGVGKLLLAFATGLLLVIALPPVVQHFPARKMTVTAAAVNVGFFGAVTAGPFVGGLVAQGHTWRWLYAALAVVGCINSMFAFLTLPDREPHNPNLPFDKPALVLGFIATVLPFWASGELVGHGFASPLFLVPMIVGIIAFFSLLLVEYRKEKPLAPVKPLCKSVPVAGVLIAMLGGAVLVTLMSLVEQSQLLIAHATPFMTGLLFLPAVLGALISAVLLGALIRSRFLALLPLAGMAFLIAASGMLLFTRPEGSRWPLLVVSGLLGIGAGATVTPGLWLAGFSVPSRLVGRTFALVELVRSEADFIVAPVLLEIALVALGAKSLAPAGVHLAVWITLGIAVVSTIGAAGVYLSGAAKLQPADLERWLERRRSGSDGDRCAGFGRGISGRAPGMRPAGG